jgi:MoaA/NifB/PqqE/SkfB family radical SAM enzyme
MSVVRNLYSAFVKQSPIYLILYVTARCNSRCRMCYYWKEIDNVDPVHELSFDEIAKISTPKNLTFLLN